MLRTKIARQSCIEQKKKREKRDASFSLISSTNEVELGFFSFYRSPPLSLNETCRQDERKKKREEREKDRRINTRQTTIISFVENTAHVVYQVFSSLSIQFGRASSIIFVRQ